MKKFLAFLMVTVMMLSLVCFAQADEPVKVTFWHSRSAGANGDQVAKAVKTFNETIGAEKGIVVEEMYQGGYTAAKSVFMNAIASGDQDLIPEIVMAERAATIPDLAIEDSLLDLTPYVEAAGIDMSNFFEAFLGFSYYNGELISLPYCRSTPAFYYNKTLADEKGLAAPVTINDLVAFGKALTEVDPATGETTRFGFFLDNDPAWFNANMVWQMGERFFSEDGEKIVCLDNNTLEKTFAAWREWVDDGWCMVPPASGSTKEMFITGKIASGFFSSGNMSNFLTNCEFEVGVAFLPTWGVTCAPTGGANISILKNNPQENLDAAWEFVKFLMTDEQIADNYISTGYLPTTKSCANLPIMQELWAEKPQYKVTFDQLSYCREFPWTIISSAFEDQMIIACSQLIQSKEITAHEAIEMLKEAAEMIYLEYGY